MLRQARWLARQPQKPWFGEEGQIQSKRVAGFSEGEINEHMNMNEKGQTLRPALYERILRIDRIQARRFGQLTGLALEIAVGGIIRHLQACERMEVQPEMTALREIMDDGIGGRSTWEKVNDDHHQVKAA
jgi:hypothetical protein